MRQPPLVNRHIHLRLFILLVALLAGGCASFSSLQFPPVPQQGAVAGAPKVGIAAVQDARSSAELGHIGLASVTAGSELTDYLHDSLRAALIQKGFSAESAPEPGNASAAGFNSAIVQVTLQTATLSSFDAIMAPAQINLVIAIEVYRSGKGSYSQTYQSDIKGYIGMHSEAGYETRIGEVLSRAVDKVVSNAMADQGFLASLN